MKSKKEKVIEPFWNAQVKVFFDFYKENFDTEPEFEGTPGPRALKGIIGSLKKRAEKNNIEWTKETACKRLLCFLEIAYKDDFLNKCFVLETINRYKDKVFQTIANPTNNVKRTSINRPAIQPAKIDLTESWR